MEVARACVAEGVRLAGSQAVSPTRIGRLLAFLLGLERKERVVQGLARLGIMTPLRRQFLERRQRVLAR